jgi:DNA-binding NarL/FixJ family response regulator
MKILIVDDHPLIVDAYKLAFQEVGLSMGIDFNIEVADTCDKAVLCIDNAVQLDVVFLDIRLPASSDGAFLSGEDVGIYLRKKKPETKIILSTTLNDNHRIHSLLKSLNPDCFLVKNDIKPKDLIASIEQTIEAPPYYSRTVLQHLRKEVSHDLLLDEIDRKLLYELSKGAKMKDLPFVLPLSIAGIERRKRQLKQIFNAESNSDLELLEQARLKGFI